MKIKIFIFCLLIALLGGAHLAEKKYLLNNNNPDEETSASTVTESVTSSKTPTPKTTSPTPPPLSFYIANVPFVPQAPFAVWDHLHDEACEEASLILVEYYLTKQPLNAEIMEGQIQKLVAWEGAYFGQSDKDLTIKELATVSGKVYKLKGAVKVVKNLDDIKKEVSQNHLVIAPFAGQLLQNPNFRFPGPVYHMLVIVGYNQRQFITNDVGTRRGLNYHYDNNIFWNALHDWNGSAANIASGSKVILVF